MHQACSRCEPQLGNFASQPLELFILRLCWEATLLFQYKLAHWEK